jgi:two-component system chemotaxis response regulator CheY
MNGPSILLVDTDDRARRALAELLREVGYAVLEAADGADGLALARERAPALVVADPWPSCGEVMGMVQGMRGVPATEQVPVIALTTLAGPEHRSAALAAGCAAYLEKPCPGERVLSEVRRVLHLGPVMAAILPRDLSIAGV